MTRSDLFAVVLTCASVAATCAVAGWLPAGFVALAGALLTLVIWRLQRAKRTSIDWQGIEARLKDLRGRETQYTRSSPVDGRIEAMQIADGSGRQRWRLSGSSTDLRAEAERLFRIAGRHLVSSGIALSPRLQREQDDLSRWLWFVVEVGQHEKDVSGQGFSPERGWVETYTHWLRGVVDESISCCVEALKRELELATK
jgi:hypothetical protein